MWGVQAPLRHASERLVPILMTNHRHSLVRPYKRLSLTAVIITTGLPTSSLTAR